MPSYLPYDSRQVNTDYRDMLARALAADDLSPTRQGPVALTVMQETMRFPLAHGFPVITERSIARFWDRAVGELCAFLNGVTSLAGLVDFGCTWWGPWVSADKTEMWSLPAEEIGPASYGGAWTRFPTLEGGTFNQVDNLLAQLRQLPYDRVHFMSPWMPAENARGEGRSQKTTIAPCHGWVHVRVLKQASTGQDRLHLHMFQRSGDTPVGVPSNTVQYAALLLMLEHLLGIEAATFYHTISDAHIYEDQVDSVRQILERDPRPYPSVTLTEAGKRCLKLQDFRREHFQLGDDYFPHPAMNSIKVAT